MQVVHHAVQLAIPTAHSLADVSAGGRMTNTAGLGHDGNLGSKTDVLCRRGSVGEDELFQYLGWILAQDNDNIHVV